MTSFAKKVLSAFVDVTGDNNPAAVQKPPYENLPPTAAVHETKAAGNSKFLQYFDKLFLEAGTQAPDYYQFAKMIEAMRTIPDERARFCAAFAGLAVQGLDKQKLLSTAANYLKLLDDDASNFDATIDSALQEKVRTKQQEIEQHNTRIQELSGEITAMHNKVSLLKAEIAENEEKIETSINGYRTEGQTIKNMILSHVEKIKTYIQ